MDRKLYIGGIVVGIIGLLALGVIWFRLTHEQVERQVFVGIGEEARRDPYLGLTRYLEALDLEVERRDRLEGPEVLEGVDLVLVSTSSVMLYEWAAQELVGWMEEGGHLVLALSNENEAWMADIYDAFELEERASGAEEEQQARQQMEDYRLGFYMGGWRTVYPKGADFMAGDLTLESVAAVSAPRGEGRLTVVQDERGYTTRYLRGEEAGRFWAELLTMNGAWPERALFYPRHAGGGWMSTVLVRGWPVWAALVLLLLAGLTRGRRFGPQRGVVDRRRQRRVDHIEAVGRFLWHYNGADVLIKASQRALMEAMARRRPSIRMMKKSQQISLMAEVLGEEEEVLRRLLGDLGSFRRNEDFRQIIARLEELRRRL